MDVPDPPEPGALAADLRLLLGRFKRRLRQESGIAELSWSQTAVLGLLDREGPATITTLARAEGVRPQSMGATIAALQERGLVAGTPDPADGRQTILSLTPAAITLIHAARAAGQDWLHGAIQSKFSAPEQQQLATGVNLLKRLLETGKS
jgi:DNA-binding MarR family transcriptional regulator